MRPKTPAATVVGLDVGTTKVCTLIARVFAEGWDVVSFASVPSRGLKRATVVDMEDATATIIESVERAEQMAGIEVRSVWVGITGHHIQSHTTEAVLRLSIEEDVITQEHVSAILEKAKKQIPISDDRLLLHVIPRQFVVDGMDGIHRPVGMAARELGVQANLVTATASFVRNLEACVKQAGIEVTGMILEPLAAGEAVLNESERQLGTALLDVGGGTTDVAVFYDGTLADTFALPVGGNHVTRDLAIGLRTPLEEAERLKILHGCALTEQAGDEPIEVMELGRGASRPLPRKVLAEIIEPRMREIFELAAERLARKGWLEMLVGGVVLTGGGSLLEGAKELAQDVFGLSVKIGEPMTPPGSFQDLRSPIYSTVIGLVMHGCRHHREREEFQPRWRRWWNRLLEWVREKTGNELRRK